MLRWQRYTDRYITPANGGLMSMADSFAYTRAILRAAGLPCGKESTRVWRWSRTNRRPARVQR